ncbi:hypothetical protein [Saccharothrix variisporea]|uniref:Uncharacterized protein n=1 Tax=Saccharothrix variisporea TaxID=543527 RepID=A0A495XL08_9PSEU|nr:hypothetical protein [Saccharothrix variisporea]RKT74787.1 hypothetical protein DFJ66_8158 [Saccharothrix variisporea]
MGEPDGNRNADHPRSGSPRRVDGLPFRASQRLRTVLSSNAKSTPVTREAHLDYQTALRALRDDMRADLARP